MKFRVKKRINRIISLVLCISMFMPFLAQYAQVYATESGTSEYAENIGGTATFDESIYENFVVAPVPFAVEEYYDAGEDIPDEYMIYDTDIPDDFVAEIVAYDQPENSASLWYQIKAADGSVWPEALGERVWVFYDFTDYPTDPSLIIEPKENTDDGTPVYDANGEAVDSIELPQYEKIELVSESDLEGAVTYQWQIQYGEGDEDWADIFGMNSETITLSYGLVATRLEANGVANIRCKSTSGDEVSYSREIPVSVEWYEESSDDESAEVVVEQEFVTSSGETVTVVISGDLPSDAELSLEETDVDDIEVKENETITAAFDIKIFDSNGEEWQPGSGESVEVTLPAEACGLDADDTYVIYHLHDDEVEILGPYTVTGETITFVVDGFSVFIFALVDEEYVPDSPYDYRDSIGMHAVINEELISDNNSFVVLDDTPAEGWADLSMVFFTHEFEDVLLEVEDYKVLQETYEYFDENDVVIEKTSVTLWYQVCVLDGNAADGEFEDGFWILQNYLNEEEAWDTDTLTLFVPEDSEEPEELFVAIKVDGEEVSEIEVGISKKVTVEAEVSVASASNAYQWQIYIPTADMWVGIAGETKPECTVNYGMVAQRLDSDGSAYIRCVITTETETVTSEEIAVTIAEGEIFTTNKVESLLNSQQKNPENILQSAKPNVSEGGLLSTEEKVPDNDEIPADQNTADSNVSADDANIADESTVSGNVDLTVEGTQTEETPIVNEDGTTGEVPSTDVDASTGDTIFKTNDATVDSNIPTSEDVPLDDGVSTSQENQTAEVAPASEDAPLDNGESTDQNNQLDEVMPASEDAPIDSAEPTEESENPEQPELLALSNKVKIVARSVFTTATPEDDDTETDAPLDQGTENDGTDYGVAPAAEETKIYNVVIDYVFENGAPAANPYTTTVGETATLNAEVDFPEVQGYLPYLNDVRTDSYTFNLVGKEMTEDFNMTVVYKPTLVDYTVVVKHQNIYDDNYTDVETVTLQGLTGSLTENIELSYPGFYQLLHAEYEIAADGSTVVEVKFDRYYYLMTFNLGDGGYGVQPVYARYGTAVEVPNPTRPGYAFQKWTDPAGTTVTSPITMPARDIEITANWTPSDAKYTVVYWRENADPESNGTYAYSYWGSRIVESRSGTVVSGSDDIPTSITNATVNGTNVNEKQYFTYNAAKTDKNVVVKGDGSTVVNVYYTRNYYTILFKGYGTCCLTPHTHGTDCNKPLICGLEPHTHDAECKGVLACGLVEHATHTEDCLICGKTEHTTHTDDCCTVIHVHTTNCYQSQYNNNRVGEQYTGNRVSGVTNPVDGYIFRYQNGNGNQRTYYIYISGAWYVYDRDNYYVQTGTIVQPTASRCSGVHVHNTGDCNCTLTHEHDAACYKDVAHTHNDSCYHYACGSVSHTHSDSCYGACTKPVHTHNNDCDDNETDNVVYVLTAKYDADISTLWPTYDKLKTNSTHYKDGNNNVENGSNQLFRGWDVDGVDNEAVSMRFNMTSDLCETDGTKDAEARYGGSYTYRLYYMFESFDTTSAENAPTRKRYDGVYFDSEASYYQELKYNTDTTFGQKPITGMSPTGYVEKTTQNNVIINWLYYTRNRHTLTFQNIDTVVRTEGNIMYGEPLATYKNHNGVEFVPDYPSDTLQVGAYEFGGWYTTAGCYPGTEFNFATETMPNADLVLYAKWQPVTHTVQFYTLKDVDGTLTGKIGDTYEVLHGSKINKQYVPEDVTNGNYTFNGWYYVDSEGTEQRFDFDNMTVTQDLVVYAKWTSDVLIKYIVHYELADGTKIADDLEGSDLAGTTETFNAKGGKDLYARYQTGFFPDTKSHSILLDINDADGIMEYTFVYTKADAVPYTVYYLAETLKTGDSGLGTLTVNGKTYHMIHATKTVSDNVNAVATENFAAVSGYMPDAYQKTLVVVPGASDNIIYFYYTVDKDHAFYKVSHYTQNLDGETWTEHYTYQSQGVIGSTYTETPMSISGFAYDENAEGGLASSTLTSAGLHLKLYYTRNKYPYKVVYKEQISGTVLHESAVATEYYGKVVSHTAPNLYANNVYRRVSEATDTLDIRIEKDPNNPELNVMVFYYEKRKVTINYEVVGPANCGTVSRETETIDIDAAASSGSTATASDENYVFKGWYTDAACTTPVPSEWVTGGKITPEKTGNLWTPNTTDPNSFTYYAKFDYNRTTLTIKKDGYSEYSTLDANQTFLFRVTGNGVDLTVTVHGETPVTVTGLTVGESYTVTEVSGWSWRYGVTGWAFTTDGNTDATGTSNSAVITLGPSGNEVLFINKRNNQYWLDGDSYIVNVFTNS